MTVTVGPFQDLVEVNFEGGESPAPMLLSTRDYRPLLVGSSIRDATPTSLGFYPWVLPTSRTRAIGNIEIDPSNGAGDVINPVRETALGSRISFKKTRNKSGSKNIEQRIKKSYESKNSSVFTSLLFYAASMYNQPFRPPWRDLESYDKEDYLLPTGTLYTFQEIWLLLEHPTILRNDFNLSDIRSSSATLVHTEVRKDGKIWLYFLLSQDVYMVPNANKWIWEISGYESLKVDDRNSYQITVGSYLTNFILAIDLDTILQRSRDQGIKIDKTNVLPGQNLGTYPVGPWTVGLGSVPSSPTSISNGREYYLINNLYEVTYNSRGHSQDDGTGSISIQGNLSRIEGSTDALEEEIGSGVANLYLSNRYVDGSDTSKVGDIGFNPGGLSLLLYPTFLIGADYEWIDISNYVYVKDPGDMVFTGASHGSAYSSTIRAAHVSSASTLSSYPYYYFMRADSTPRVWAEGDHTDFGDVPKYKQYALSSSSPYDGRFIYFRWSAGWKDESTTLGEVRQATDSEWQSDLFYGIRFYQERYWFNYLTYGGTRRDGFQIDVSEFAPNDYYGWSVYVREKYVDRRRNFVLRFIEGVPSVTDEPLDDTIRFETASNNTGRDFQSIWSSLTASEQFNRLRGPLENPSPNPTNIRQKIVRYGELVDYGSVPIKNPFGDSISGPINYDPWGIDESAWGLPNMNQDLFAGTNSTETGDYTFPFSSTPSVTKKVSTLHRYNNTLRQGLFNQFSYQTLVYLHDSKLSLVYRAATIDEDRGRLYYKGELIHEMENLQVACDGISAAVFGPITTEYTHIIRRMGAYGWPGGSTQLDPPRGSGSMWSDGVVDDSPWFVDRSVSILARSEKTRYPAMYQGIYGTTHPLIAYQPISPIDQTDDFDGWQGRDYLFNTLPPYNRDLGVIWWPEAKPGKNGLLVIQYPDILGWWELRKAWEDASLNLEQGTGTQAELDTAKDNILNGINVLVNNFASDELTIIIPPGASYIILPQV